jgi:hypothetical protein
MAIFRWLILLLALRFAAQGMERPVDYLVDERGLFSAEERAALTNEIAESAKKRGLVVYLVLPKETSDTPALEVAETLALEWTGVMDRIVIYESPDMDEPQIAFRGETLGVLTDDQQYGLADAALRATQTIPAGPARLAAIARHLLAQGKALRAGGPLAAPVSRAAAERDSGLARWGLRIGLPGLMGLAGILTYWLWRRGRRQPLLFPQPTYRKRFAAPHSGGNNAIITFPTRGGS